MAESDECSVSAGAKSRLAGGPSRFEVDERGAMLELLEVEIDEHQAVERLNAQGERILWLASELRGACDARDHAREVVRKVRRQFGLLPNQIAVTGALTADQVADLVACVDRITRGAAADAVSASNGDDTTAERGQ